MFGFVIVGSVWSKIKLKSRNREYFGFKWERVKVSWNFILKNLVIFVVNKLR